MAVFIKLLLNARYRLRCAAIGPGLCHGAIPCDRFQSIYLCLTLRGGPPKSRLAANLVKYSDSRKGTACDLGRVASYLLALGSVEA